MNLNTTFHVAVTRDDDTIMTGISARRRKSGLMLHPSTEAADAQGEWSISHEGTGKRLIGRARSATHAIRLAQRIEGGVIPVVGASRFKLWLQDPSPFDESTSLPLPGRPDMIKRLIADAVNHVLKTMPRG